MKELRSWTTINIVPDAEPLTVGDGKELLASLYPEHVIVGRDGPEFGNMWKIEAINGGPLKVTVMVPDDYKDGVIFRGKMVKQV